MRGEVIENHIILVPKELFYIKSISLLAMMEEGTFKWAFHSKGKKKRDNVPCVAVVYY